MKTIPVETQTINMETGEIIEQRATAFQILPPAKDVCQVCATKHDPLLPHNVQSLHYAYAFRGAIGRWPTWADACAHCDTDLAERWRKTMSELGHKWTRPPDGYHPVRDLGPVQV
jgi:hypothetical protein